MRKGRNRSACSLGTAQVPSKWPCYARPAAPRSAQIRAVWSARLAGRATPLLVVVLTGERAALCGPSGDPPPAFLGLDVGRVERICRTALAEPDRHAALRFLATVIPEADGPLPGVRNEGLFATHELQKGLPGSKALDQCDCSGKIGSGLAGRQASGAPRLHHRGHARTGEYTPRGRGSAGGCRVP